MRKNDGLRRYGGRFYLYSFALIAAQLSFQEADGSRLATSFPVPSRNADVAILGPIAANSDSIYCDGRLLERGREYEVAPATGRIRLLASLPCESLTVSVILIPQWMMEPAGNPPPEGRHPLKVSLDPTPSAAQSSSSPQKISLSGNKSFSMAVGRSGESRFSQGLNVDFDAVLADGLQVRGAISDRIGTETASLGTGGTTMLSELDKYFFEIEGRRLRACGGDISLSSTASLPSKKIKGVNGSYQDRRLQLSAGIGRPSGRFASQKLAGVDGRQGPYQLNGDDGRPAAVVPGSEKVYFDGQELEPGSDRHYQIDYPSGRIVFSPRVLVTSRSRIEVDFEVAQGNYEQVISDMTGAIAARDTTFRIEAGWRREADEKDHLLFGSYSAAEVALIEAAGDDPDLAVRRGVQEADSGAYRQTVDSAGQVYYQYVGEGGGDYDLSFSLVGEGLGDYRYLGDGIYEFVGAGAGDYLPVVYLVLPERRDQFCAAASFKPYAAGSLKLGYEAMVYDRNLFACIEDGDNYSGLLSGEYRHTGQIFSAGLSGRLRQEDYHPLKRLDVADFERLWALPADEPTGDEILTQGDFDFTAGGHTLQAQWGYREYDRYLRSHFTAVKMRLLQNRPLTPALIYQGGRSQMMADSSGSGLYEKINPSLEVKPWRAWRLTFDVDREITKDLYDSIPEVERYTQYRTRLFFRRSALTFSRRIDFSSDFYGYKGPQADRLELSVEERVGPVQVNLAGTWLDQKALDSDRESRRDRLYQAAVAYTTPGGWLALASEYRQNLQSARPTSFKYIQVTDGEGDYRYEGGQYLLDSDGDYIRIREETGSLVAVTVGEKSHHVTLYPGRLTKRASLSRILSQAALRLRTEVYEESPGGDRHRLNWLLPWISPSGNDYLTRRRREGYSAMFFPRQNFYLLDFSYSSLFEEEDSGAQLERRRLEYKIELKEQLAPAVRGGLVCRHQRQVEKGTAVVAMRLRQHEYIGRLAVNSAQWQFVPELGYLRLFETLSQGRGVGVSLGAEIIYRRSGRGEVRLAWQLCSLTEKRSFTQPEYLITTGRRFGKSARLDLTAGYEIGRSMRLTVTIRDRIYEDHPSEFNGRGELVASF